MILVIALPVLALGAGALFLRAPKVVLTNYLTASVDVRVGQESLRVAPGERLTLRVARAHPLELTWRLEQRLGVAFADSVAVAQPQGRIFVAATARPKGRAYFAPVITNQTGRPLTVIVNAGLAGAQRCACTIPPGAVRMAIGYYPLFGNSTVRVQDPSGRAAMFQNLGSQVDVANGVVGLLFRAADLR